MAKNNKATAWKGIQKKANEAEKTLEMSTTRSRSASISSDEFKDAVSDEDMMDDEDEEDEDDDYFQDEDLEEDNKQKELLKLKQKAIEQDKQRYLNKDGQSVDNDDDVDEFSLEPHLKSQDTQQEVQQEAQEKQEQEVSTPTKMSFILPALQNHGLSDEEEEDDDNESLKDPNEKFNAVEEKNVKQQEPTPIVTSTTTAGTTITTKDTTVEAKEIKVESEHTTPDTKPTIVEKPATYEPIPALKPVNTPRKSSESDEIHTEKVIVTQNNNSSHTEETQKNDLSELSSILQNLRPIIESNFQQKPKVTITDEEPKVVEKENSQILENRTFEELPKENKRESIQLHESPKEQEESAKYAKEFGYPMEDPIDLDMFKDNTIAIQSINPKDIPVNILKPREQEKADEPVRQGMKYLFDNKFMKAKNIFQTKASVDPLYALGLGAMAFIKALMTYNESDMEQAMNALATAYTVAKTQIDNSSFKKPFKDTVNQYFTTFLSNNNSGLPSDPPSMSTTDGFIPNGVLRAHVIKAECCLLMGILQMTQESVIGYLKCGLNIRRAYYSYSVVWQEYKRMGQDYTNHMDSDTVSAIQFGIGAVHLILSSMPPKILKIFSALGWKSDKQLGFALLKLCLEGRGIRAPLASLTLLAYYSVLTSYAPQLYTKDMMNPAIECLLGAQSNHPNSCFFLFFAARIARVAKNLPLSTQSFIFASESSRGEWAEVAMKQMSDYEIGFNLALQLDWIHAVSYFEQLSQEKYWSPAFTKYIAGACYEMLGQRTEAILAFAEVPQLASESDEKKTYIDAFVLKKVEFFQKSGYQDIDLSLPGFEILLVMNAFEYMEKENLEQCLDRIQNTLELISEREKSDFNIRLKELVPSSTPPNYYEQRAVLLLTKASILNSLGRHTETIPHLNWIIDHKEFIKLEAWILPFTYWESGVTSWGLGNYIKSRKLWQSALACTKYDFEYRMALRLSIALSKCDEVGASQIDEKNFSTNSTINGRKRMPVLIS